MEKITYDDVQEFEKFFKLVPSFLLERYAKKNTNIVLKFKSKVQSFIDNLDDEHKKMFDKLLEYGSDSKYDIYDLLEDLTVDCLVDFLENYELRCRVTARVELSSDTEIYIPLRDVANSYCLEDVIYDDSCAMDDIFNDLEADLRYSDVEIEVDRVY